MDFRLADFGEVFSTRPRGLEVRESLRQQLAPGETVAVSFDSVAKVSQSFSDEFLAALITELGPDQVSIEGTMTPSVERVLSRALRRRSFAEVSSFRAVTA